MTEGGGGGLVGRGRPPCSWWEAAHSGRRPIYLASTQDSLGYGNVSP